MRRFLHLLVSVLSCCCLIAGSQSIKLFNQQDLRVHANKNGVGGRLVYGHGHQQVEVYAFEKSMKYLVSPDAKRIAITDTGGTASFSIFIIDCKLKQSMLDHKIYRLKPELKDYSSVYPSVRQWVSDDSISVDVEAFGPFKKGIPQKVNFQMVVNIPIDQR